MHKLMIDIETLSTRPNAVVLSIGAVVFNEDTILDRFYATVNNDYQLTAGRYVCIETVNWWNKQPPEVKSSAFAKNPESPIFTLCTFKTFIDRNSVSEIWANGPDFDCVILNSLFRDFEFCENLLDFRKYRCFRTLKKLIPLDATEIAPNISAHNALSDAAWQANYVIKALKKLNGNISQ